MIEIRWKEIKRLIIFWLFAPYCILLALFSLLTITNDMLYSEYIYAGIIKGFMFVISIYLLVHEIIQALNSDFFSYFGSFFNYIDISAVLLIPVTIALSLIESISDDAAAPMYSICSFLLWLKFLYFLRIFR